MVPDLGEALRRLDLSGTCGLAETHLAGVRLFWSKESGDVTSMAYEAGIVLVLQGAKVGYVGTKRFDYNAGNYLVLTAPLPLQCVTIASPETPVFGLFVEIDKGEVMDLVARLEAAGSVLADGDDAYASAVNPAPMTDAMADAARRLWTTAIDPRRAAVLGPCARREVLFNVLSGARAAAVASLVRHGSGEQKLDRVVTWIRRHHATQMTVDALAEKAGMSPSVFHRAFRRKTGYSPIQYLKRLRLHYARRLLAYEGLRVGEAAQRVGYESVSQFSREYRRLFAEPPTAAKASAIAHPGAFAETMRFGA